MAIEVGSAYVTLMPSMKGFGTAVDKGIGPTLKSSGQKAGADMGDGMKKGLKGRLGGIKTMVGGLLAFEGAKKTVEFLKGTVEAGRESNRVAAQTAAVIKSTGGAANVSAKQLDKLVTSISNKTGVDDEAIQSGANMLLTFKNIRNEAGKGNDIFNQTTSAVTDLSVAMGTDQKNAAIMLGKALNDPIKGISALSRVGITFSKQQREQIKNLVEQGKTAEAQKIMLKEVNSEVGGSAAAQGTAMDKLKVQLGNVQESIGQAIIPIIDKLATFLAKHLPAAIETAGKVFNWLGGVFRKVGGWVKDAYNVLVKGDFQSVMARTFDNTKYAGFLTFIIGLRLKIERLIKYLKTTVIPAIKTFIQQFKDGEGAGGKFREFLEKLRDVLEAVGKFILTKVIPAMLKLAGWFKDHKKTTMALVGSFVALKAAMAGIKAIKALNAATMLKYGAAVEKVKKIQEGLSKAMTFFKNLCIGTRIQLFALKAAEIAKTVATKAATVAQKAMNLAMRMNPIGLIITAIMLLVGAVIILWKKNEAFRNFFKAAWKKIQEAVSFAWNRVIKPVFNAIVGFIKDKLIPWFQSIWDKVKGVFSKVGGFIVSFVKGYIKVYFAIIKNAIRALITTFKAIWTAVKWTFDKVKSGISFAWNRVIKPIFGRLTDGVNALKEVFRKVKDKIGSIWSGLTDKVKRPINAVLNFIKDKFLRPLQNLINKIPGVDLHFIGPRPPANPGNSGRGNNGYMYAKGSSGILPGYSPGVDNYDFYSPSGIHLRLGGGEGIARPEMVKAFGRDTWNTLNAAARKGGSGAVRRVLGFKSGGVFDDVKPMTGSANIKRHWWDVLGLAKDKVMGFGSGLFDRLKDSLGSNMLTEAAIGVGRKGLSAIWDKVKSLFGGGSGVGGAGHARGWQQQWRIAQQLGIPVQMTSNYRPGAITASGYRSYHGLGRAIDLVGPNMMAIFNAIRARYGKTSKELYYSPAGMRQIQNGHPHYPTGITRANHFSHVHWAMANGGLMPELFDQGGAIQPGVSLVANKTRQPEQVLTSQQWNDIKDGGATTITINGVKYDTTGEMADELAFAMRRASSGRYNRRR